MSRQTWLLSVALVTILASQSMAQDFLNAPLPLPPLKKDFVAVETVDRGSIKVSPGVAAVVDGQALNFADLMWVLLETNLATIANNLIDMKMCELEMERANVKISQEEIDAELKEILPRFAPGKTAEQLVSEGVFTAEYLKRTAMTSRGWKVLMWAAKNVPEDRRSDQANGFMLRLYKSELMSKYSIMIRGRKPSPPKGAIAALSTIIKNKTVTYSVLPYEAMNFLQGVLRPATVIQGQRQLVANFLVQRAMNAKGSIVTDSEIEGYVREMQQKFKPPFSWNMVLQAKGLTQDQERVRWHNVQAWIRSTNADVSSEAIQEFRKQHDEHFRSRYVKVKHILVSTVEMSTGMSKGEDAVVAGKKKAEKILELIEEGVPFDDICKEYSDDSTNAATGGELPQPVKALGGSYDRDFSQAACKLTKKGEITGPVKSVFGWHIIKAKEINPAKTGPIDFLDPRYADWIRDEYETHYMNQWMKELQASADIKYMSRDEVLEIKKATVEKVQ
ncbi:MAG: parvulin-like peptidyl-prolyl isomerase [Planctomycetota bacterium]|jgi:parvulin-like peptidyl-prolyl isomerase